MRRAVSIALLLAFAPFPALADTVKLKSGETKTGTVIAQEDDHILFKSESDATVVEIPRDSISILDGPVGDKKGSVGFFSTVPKKKKKAKGAPFRTLAQAMDPNGKATQNEIEEEESGPTTFEKLDSMFTEWMEKHPEAAKWFQDMADKSIKDSDRLDALANAAKSK